VVVAPAEEQGARGTVQEGKARDLDWAAVEWAEAAPAEGQERAGPEVAEALERAEADCGSLAVCPAAVAEVVAGLGLAAQVEDRGAEVGRVEEVAQAVVVRSGPVALVGEAGLAREAVRVEEAPAEVAPG
jgi:hypothetical protein